MSWVAVGARFHLDKETVGRKIPAPHLHAAQLTRARQHVAARIAAPKARWRVREHTLRGAARHGLEG